MSKVVVVTAKQVRAARGVGALYLAFVIVGALGFLVVRSALFDEPAAIVTALSGHGLLASFSVSLELTTVLIQALLALFLYQMFRSAAPVAASGVLAFGMVNAVTILVSASTLATARDLVNDSTLAPDGSVDATAQMLLLFSGQVWETAGLFFGLWLIPLGIAVRRSGLMSAALGWMLVVGGVGKTVNSLLTPLLDNASWISTVLTVPQNVAEFWVVGYLLVLGVRPRMPQSMPAASDQA